MEFFPRGGCSSLEVSEVRDGVYEGNTVLGAWKDNGLEEGKTGEKETDDRDVEAVLDGIVPDEISVDTDDGMFANILIIVDEETEGDIETAGADEAFSLGWLVLVATLIWGTFPGRAGATGVAPTEEHEGSWFLLADLKNEPLVFAGPCFKLSIADFASAVL